MLASSRLCISFCLFNKLTVVNIPFDNDIGHYNSQNDAPSGFPFLDYADSGDFTLLFCRGRLRNFQSLNARMLSSCSGH